MATSVLNSSPLSLDRRCTLGQRQSSLKIKNLCKNTHFYSHSHRKIGVLACRKNAVSSNNSWVFGNERFYSDGYGGWANSEVLPYKKKAEPGLQQYLIGGVQISIASSLAAFICYTLSNKGFSMKPVGLFSNIHHFLSPPASSEPLRICSTLSANQKLITSKTVVSEFNQDLEKLEIDKDEVRSPPDIWKIVVPPAMDVSQSDALHALAKLKIAQPHLQAQELCSRREFARWLFLLNHLLSRGPQRKVFLPMLNDGLTQTAFDDVDMNDPDFSYIQGLAEAGIIPSRLTGNNECHILFCPERPISREDLVTWITVTEHRQLPLVDKRTLEEKSGFIDCDRISSDAWPAVLLDVMARGQSVAWKAFGYSKRLQPKKPVTKGQAAIALISGHTTCAITDELARVEAEKSARDAMTKEILSEMISRGEIKSRWEKDISFAKIQREEAENNLRLKLLQVEMARTEKLESLPDFVKEIAKLETERRILSSLKDEAEQLKKKISDEESEVLFERQQIEHSRKVAKMERESSVQSRSVVEAERRALKLYRLWLEEMAKQAQAQGEILAAAARRWGFSDSSVVIHDDSQSHNLQRVYHTDYNSNMFSSFAKNMPFAAECEQYFVNIYKIALQALHYVQNKIRVDIKSNEVQR